MLGLVVTMMAISHFMTRQPWTISRTATLAEAHRLMRDRQIHHLPVIDNGELVGIVSEGDLNVLESIAEVALERVLVQQAMSPRPFYVTGDTSIDEVTEIMAEHKYGSCIVIGRQGVEGIFTGVDACRALSALIARYTRISDTDPAEVTAL
jgi:acetoin utilization protein AcuB